ncbi:SRPBCC family protein [Leptospira bandrabouensis]|uniref:SRPBCC family protein n=1 Tax=Leptospira bandrabouensis TaxID=2484903 RepID=UPI001EE832A7|nr:SRPBCC family protein [Leptospira bandrabouensis]MCG6145561.1 SRPBCC family protein [Leptospira bandrabouensis]MCG6161185.1 SRPBCC family protein [Leptospira bandrabouensis]MCG6164691.1 SRPBCC family protein [Leptospira bandrabouensis]MCW7459076.1 SRPBCC family protein [Leptospira bandrabouensis]MCW7477847.1 SRPBCC family protein [Leptospira bandrabouensis]
MIKNNTETRIKDNQVTYKRYFDVDVDLLFEVWSKPEHLSEWWGPDGFTLTIKSLDFSNGGIWEFVMHGPDGHDYKNKIQFIEISKPHFILYQHLGDGEGDEDVNFQSRIVFEKAGEGTNLIMEQIFSDKQELERVNEKYGAIEGGKQHIGNLAKYLERISKP